MRGSVSGRFAVLIALGVVVGAVVAGCGGSSSSPHLKIYGVGGATGTSGAIGAFAYVPTASSPPPISARSALRQVVASLKSPVVFSFRSGRVVAVRHEPSHLVSVRVGRPPGPVQAYLHITVKSPGSKNGGFVEPQWEADLLLGAVAELTAKSWTLQGSAFDDVREQLPNGKVTDIGSNGIGELKRGQQFAGANETDTAIRNSVARVASRFGLSVDSVTIFHALGAAPAVVLTAPDISTAMAKSQSLLTALFGSRPRYEGYYIELRTEDGKPYVEKSASYLTGSGRG